MALLGPGSPTTLPAHATTPSRARRGPGTGLPGPKVLPRAQEGGLVHSGARGAEPHAQDLVEPLHDRCWRGGDLLEGEQRGAAAQARQPVQDDPVVVDPKARGQLRLALELGITAPIERIDDLPGSPVDEHESRLGQQPLPEGQEEVVRGSFQPQRGRPERADRRSRAVASYAAGMASRTISSHPSGSRPPARSAARCRSTNSRSSKCPSGLPGPGTQIVSQVEACRAQQCGHERGAERCMPTMMRGCERNGRALIRATRLPQTRRSRKRGIHAALGGRRVVRASKMSVVRSTR